MRKITLIIIHCSATRVDHSYTFGDCREDHIHHRHFKDIGYHYYITRDGSIHKGRPEEQVGAHCRNHNRYSIGICYEGGLDTKGKAADTRTPAQRAALHALVHSLRRDYPQAIVVGHHTLDPHKDCPCFDVKDL